MTSLEVIIGIAEIVVVDAFHNGAIYPLKFGNAKIPAEVFGWRRDVDSSVNCAGAEARRTAVQRHSSPKRMRSALAAM
jgi:hypothetical protein